MGWTLKPEGYVGSRLVAMSGHMKAKKASSERGVRDKEMTGTRQAMREVPLTVGMRPALLGLLFFDSLRCSLTMVPPTFILE